MPWRRAAVVPALRQGIFVRSYCPAGPAQRATGLLGTQPERHSRLPGPYRSAAMRSARARQKSPAKTDSRLHSNRAPPP